MYQGTVQKLYLVPSTWYRIIADSECDSCEDVRRSYRQRKLWTSLVGGGCTMQVRRRLIKSIAVLYDPPHECFATDPLPCSSLWVLWLQQVPRYERTYWYRSLYMSAFEIRVYTAAFAALVYCYQEAFAAYDNSAISLKRPAESSHGVLLYTAKV